MHLPGFNVLTERTCLLYKASMSYQFIRFNSLARRIPAAVRHRMPAKLLFTAAMSILPGCRLLVGTVVVAVGAVGLIGYGVYKTGEGAVTGVGYVVSGTTEGISSLIFSDGEFKTTCDGTVNAVWLASASTMKANGFQVVSGGRDSLSGRLEATGWNNEKIAIKLDAKGKDKTEFRVRIGATGDLKKSETLYRMITTELARQGGSQGQG